MNLTGPRRPLLSIILITNSSRGQQLVFRYPDNQYAVGEPNVPPPPGPSRPVSTQKGTLHGTGSKDSLRTAPGKDTVTSHKPKSLMPQRPIVHSMEKFGTLFGYTTEFLASMLSPEPLLCDQPFQLTIDDLTFIGYPTLLSRKSSMAVHPHNEDPTIQLFHLVFVVQEVPFGSSVIPAYHRLIQQITSGLTHEELRCGFLSEQVKKMLSERDGYVPDPGSRETLTTWILARSLLAQHIREVYDSLAMPELKSDHSTRANFLAPTDTKVHIKLNNWVPIHWSLNTSLDSTYRNTANAYGESQFTGYSSGYSEDYPSDVRLAPSTLRPFHTLLLFDEPSVLLQTLPTDCSPALAQLIAHSTPMKSFGELAMETDIPLAFVYRLASHLVYWQAAVIVNKLSKNNIYTVSPSANTDFKSEVAMSFARHFPGHNLATVLTKFSQPKQLSEHVDSLGPNQMREQINMVIWLLKRRMLMELHTFVYLLVPGVNVSPDSSFPDMPEETKSEWLDPHEYQYIQRLAASENPRDFSLFLRLAPYFRGGHHVEEIMWRENISRSEISTVLAKYRDVLETCLQEG